MPDDVYTAVVTIPYVGAISARDEITNSWHFTFPEDVEPDGDDWSQLVNGLIAFYNGVVSGTPNKLCLWLSATLSRVTNAARIDVYKEPSGPSGHTGPPKHTVNWTLGAIEAGNTALPQQLAIVLTFHGDITATPESVAGTRPAARRRGRIYLGPWAPISLGSTTAFPTIDPVRADLVTSICNHASVLMLGAAIGSWEWVAFSRSTWASYPVVGGWVDNRWDVVRARADSRGSKTTF